MKKLSIILSIVFILTSTSAWASEAEKKAVESAIKDAVEFGEEIKPDAAQEPAEEVKPEGPKYLLERRQTPVFTVRIHLMTKEPMLRKKHTTASSLNDKNVTKFGRKMFNSLMKTESVAYNGVILYQHYIDFTYELAYIDIVDEELKSVLNSVLK